MKRGGLGRLAKRAIDLSVACIALIMFGPLLGLIALAIRLRIGSPVIFRQMRGGLRGRPFQIYKFRTMSEARDSAGRLLPDSERQTVLGRWLRASSLDELPSLWNIVRGELSLVGPRPLLADYLDRYSPQHFRRHDVPPGLTGWAQVNGRNDLPFSKRFELDLWYVDNWRLGLDLKILAMTFARVLARRNVGVDADYTLLDDVGLMQAGGEDASSANAGRSLRRAA